MNPGFRPGGTGTVAAMETVELAIESGDVAAVRRLFGQYRRAVEGYASAADVCA